MCNLFKKPKVPEIAVASPDNAQAAAQANLEAALRRKWAGAAADVLTGPGGIPSTAKLGGVAA